MRPFLFANKKERGEELNDLALDTLLFNDAYALLTAANGMQDCDANWDRLQIMADNAFMKHKEKRTEVLAETVYLELLKHIQQHCTTPEQIMRAERSC